LAHSTPVVAALKRESRTIPIVFTSVSDPIGSGFIASLPRPGGQITGFLLYEDGTAVYFYRAFVTAGGLMSYDTDRVEPFSLAAGYVDRILKGEKPADLPVQAPTKYETVLNLKTAKALGVDVPPVLLARADEVIE
jgi:putative ABC transport system substrate-binding protein